MRDFYLDRDQRIVYLKTMINILSQKYYVDKSKLARAMGFATAYMYDFLNDRKYPRHGVMDRMELFINDLYEPLVRDEIELNRAYFEGLSAKSIAEEE